MQLMQFLTLGFECSLLYFGQAKLQQTPCVFCVAQRVEYFLKLYVFAIEILRNIRPMFWLSHNFVKYMRM